MTQIGANTRRAHQLLDAVGDLVGAASAGSEGKAMLADIAYERDSVNWVDAYCKEWPLSQEADRRYRGANTAEKAGLRLTPIVSGMGGKESVLCPRVLYHKPRLPGQRLALDQIMTQSKRPL